MKHIFVFFPFVFDLFLPDLVFGMPLVFKIYDYSTLLAVLFLFYVDFVNKILYKICINLFGFSV